MTRLPANVSIKECIPSLHGNQQHAPDFVYKGSEQNGELLTWLMEHDLNNFEGGPPVIDLPGLGLLDAKKLVDIRLKRRDELDTRISAQRKLIEALVGNRLVSVRGELALLLYERYSDFGGFELLQEAISLFIQVLDLDSFLDLEQKARLLIGLGGALCSRFKQSKDLSDIEQSLAVFESARLPFSGTTKFAVETLLGLGIARFWFAYSKILSTADVMIQLADATAMLEHASTLSSFAPSLEAECNLYLELHLLLYQDYAPSRAHMLSSCLSKRITSSQHAAFVSLALIWCLCTYVSKCYDNSDDALLVAHVINYAIQHTGHPDERLSSYLLTYFMSEYAWMDTHHRRNGIFRSVSMLRHVTKSCNPQSILSVHANQRFTGTLYVVYSMTGHLKYLEELITLFGHLDLRGGLARPLMNNFAMSLAARFDVVGDIKDLQKSTELLERCVPQQGMSRGQITYALNLGRRYIELSQLSQGDVTLVDKAITLFEACDQICNEWNEFSPQYHSSAGGLVIALCEKFKLRGNIVDLEKAVSVAKIALNHRSEASDVSKNVSSALALAMRYLGLARHDVAILQSALRTHMYCTAAMPPEYSGYTAILGEQAVTRAHLWRLSHKDLHFYAGTATFRQLMQNEYSRPNDRLAFALHWINVCTEFGNPRLVSEAYDGVLRLLMRAMPLDWSTHGRLTSLKNFPAVASSAALHYLTEKDVTRALERLEGGRALLWSRSLLLRQSFARVPPQMGERLNLLAQSLQQTVHDRSAILRRRQQSDEFDGLVEDIRRLPKLHDFLRPASYNRLREVTSAGPLLILLGNDTAAYAIIACSPSSEPSSVPLPNLSQVILDKMASAVSDAAVDARDCLGDAEDRKMTKSSRARTMSTEDILADLWTTIMRPVVQALKLEEGNQPPRLWILPVGRFALLPLHAAGVYSGTQQTCLMNYCIPSYIPSMQALINARHDAPSLAVRQAKCIMVAEPQAPASPPLPNTVPEVEGIATLLARAAQVTTVVGRTKINEVTEHITGSSIVHLACHGQQDIVEPLQSGFLLGDGKLTVSKLMSLQLPSASVAFLSACESAMGDKSLPDEAIHLSAAMLFIGFRSVVGTMWSMHDVDGPQVMKKIYEALLDAGDDATYDVIPRALEAAVRELRDSGVPASRWATYIHMGM